MYKYGRGQCDPICNQLAPFRNASSKVKRGELVQRLRQGDDSVENKQPGLLRIETLPQQVSNEVKLRGAMGSVLKTPSPYLF